MPSSSAYATPIISAMAIIAMVAIILFELLSVMLFLFSFSVKCPGAPQKYSDLGLDEAGLSHLLELPELFLEPGDMVMRQAVVRIPQAGNAYKRREILVSSCLLMRRNLQ